MEIKAKQDYLCKEIIQANYDPQQFQDYIQNIKGLNLQLYSMNELIEIVQKFKRADKQAEGQKHIGKKAKAKQSVQVDKNKQLQLNQQDQKELRSLKTKQNEFQIKKDSFNSSTKIYHEIIGKTNYPILYKKIFLKKQKVFIKIRSYSKNQQHSLFRSSYVAYHIETTGLNWSSKRRFKDFQWLHLKLAQMYPGLPIPPIPKKTPVRYFDEKHLEQRMIFFQKFLNRLTHIPEICSDKILQEFLSVSSTQQLTVCKEQFQNKLNNKGKKIYSIKGADVINMSCYIVDHKQHQFYSKSQQFIKCLNGEIAAFQKSLKIATERAYELSSTFAQVYQHFGQKKQVVGSKIFQLMGDFIYQIGQKLESQHMFIKNNMSNYWSYEQKYLQNITENIVKINKQQYDMICKYKNISNVTDEIATGQNSIQNRLFNQYLLNKEMYRIKLSFLLQQIQRCEKQDFLILASDWVQSLRNYIGEVKNQMISGADQLTKAICLGEGKNLMQVQYISSKNVEKYSKINLKQS